jgi:CshA-type fibril repeat protein
VTVAGEGTYTLNVTSGLVTFSPEPNFVGVATSIPYIVADGNGIIVDSTITISITAPTARPDVSSGLPGVTQFLNVLTNDSTATGTNSTFIASSVRLCLPTEVAPNCSATTLVTADGRFSVDVVTGIVSFVPAAGFTGTVTSPPTYSVTDSNGQRASSTITPTVIAPPAPLATDDTRYGPVGVPMTFEPWVNDTPGVPSVDPSGNIAFGVPTFSMTSVRLCSSTQTPPNCNESTVVTVDGEYVVNPNGSVTFTPAPGFTGTATVPVTYQISTTTSVVDHGSPSAAIITLTSAVLHPVVVAPTPPMARDDSGSAEFGRSVTLQPWMNDVPLAGSTVGNISFINDGFMHASVTLCGPGESTPVCSATVLTTVDGRYVVNPDGSVTFTPATGFSGTVTAPPRYQISNAFRITNSDGSTTLVETEIVTARLIPTIGAPPSLSAQLPVSGAKVGGFAILAATMLTLGALLRMSRRLSTKCRLTPAGEQNFVNNTSRTR